MDYFFGNERNDKGMCATEGCTGEPLNVFVYKYCEKCFAAIAKDMEAGLIVTLDGLTRRQPGHPPASPPSNGHVTLT